MTKPNHEELFDFIIKQVRDLGNRLGTPQSRAFPRWFAEMYYFQPEDMFASDGAGDAKIDLFFHTVSGSSVTRHVVNSKFTEAYNQTAPVGFYDEVLAFYQLFNESSGRGKFLQQKVKAELRPRYRALFEAFDAGKAKLLFLTNCRKNVGQLARVEHLPVETFHLEDLIQHVLDDLDGAMPRTPDLRLQHIGSTLSPPKEEVGISTTLVFARLVDFVRYLDDDPYDLLFARNVRTYHAGHPVNKAIRETFLDHPEQFAYSSNGVTLLCEEAIHNPGTHELRIVNPRVVNGSQTLHSVRDAARELSGLAEAQKNARVMVRIVRIPPPAGAEAATRAVELKEIINRISIRSNQQIPVRPWDLRANDDFQMGIARRFRRENLFYERRNKEWRQRSSQLKNVGIYRGPSIKRLMAQLAAYHWKQAKLGPTLAKGNVGELFQGEAYDTLVERTTDELAYQVYLVSQNVKESLDGLGKVRYQNARRLIDLAVCALVFEALGHTAIAWKKPELSAFLNQQWDDWGKWERAWRDLTRQAADIVLEQYEKARRRVERKEHEQLTLRNFVVRRDDLHRMLTAGSPLSLRRAARAAVEGH